MSPAAKIAVDAINFPATRRAARILAEKQILTPDDFYSINAQARSQAFTVSADITQRARGVIRDNLAEMIETGPDRQAFLKRFEKLPLSESHLEQVFRNNTLSAYSDGLEDTLQHPFVYEAFPYRQYIAHHDDRVRDEHLALESMGLDGTGIYHIDDPVWQIFRPPWSWNCRCWFIPLSVIAAANAGVSEAQQWHETGLEPQHVFVPFPDFLPDPSWIRPPLTT